MFREGIRSLLDAQDDLHVVGEASDGHEAVELTRKLHPQVLVVDVLMPRMNGLEAAKQIQISAPETKVLVLSGHLNEAYIIQALKCGAGGYILKQEDAAKLVQAVRDVNSGGHYLSPAISERAIRAYVEKVGRHAHQDGSELTQREYEIVHLIAQGHMNAEIADVLCISIRTVETHRSNIMHKLGLRSKADLIRYCMQLESAEIATVD